METLNFKATVISGVNHTGSKSNGGAYTLQNCLVTEGPLKGKVVTGTRTIKNKDGEIKDSPEVGTEVTLHARVEDNGNGPKPFFEIQIGIMSASDAEILALLGVTTAPKAPAMV